MSIIKYHSNLELLVSIKGHPLNRDAFMGLFEGWTNCNASAVEQPASQLLLNAKCADNFSACVFYDMPGINFTTNQDPPELISPNQQFQNDFLAMLERGMGCVFLHHSIASWPTWAEFENIIGGRFLYRPNTLRGKPCLDSGYRHEVKYQAQCLQDHPILADLPTSFELCDELYLFEVFESEVIALLRSDYDFKSDNFYSAHQAVQGNMFNNQGWQHGPGSSLIAWVKHYKNSPIVYIQCGDSEATYNNPQFQKLLQNATRWVASSEALAWAKARNSTL